MDNQYQNSVSGLKALTPQEKEALERQNARLVSEFRAAQFEANAKRHWDLFYKRNEDRFFKDRHWTSREFTELADVGRIGNGNPKTLLEAGCGVGNFFYPLLEEVPGLVVWACDLSPRAIDIVKADKRYDSSKVKAFQCDLTKEDSLSPITDQIDIATLIFVLSSIHPNKFHSVLKSVFEVMRPGGILLLRDYGLHDMAQLRFKPGTKISDNFYVRQDGTRSYFFSLELLDKLFREASFQIISNEYINRRTVNLKEGIDVPRIFVQSKCRRPS